MPKIETFKPKFIRLISTALALPPYMLKREKIIF